MEQVGSLNKQLREFVFKDEKDRTNELNTNNLEDKNIKTKNFISNLLLLEERNYKVTIQIFLLKIAKYELLKKNVDEDEYESQLEEISKLKYEQITIRTQINEMIQELIYS
jgi:hypothetical protein